MCAWNNGLKLVANIVVARCIDIQPSSGGPTMDTTSGSAVSSVANVLVNCSSNDFLGSTFVGDKQVSNVIRGSVEKLNDCFFLMALLGVLLDVRNIVLRLSPDACVSFGGLLAVFCGSELGASGSVLPAFPSFPLLSARHDSLPRSMF